MSYVAGCHNCVNTDLLTQITFIYSRLLGVGPTWTTSTRTRFHTPPLDISVYFYYLHKVIILYST